MTSVSTTTMTLQAFFLLLLVLNASFVCLLLIKRKNKTRKLPPGPKRLPIIGNLHQLSNLDHRSLQVLSNKHGPLMFLQLGSVPAIVVSSADIARDIFKAHDLIFSGRPVFYTGKKISYDCSSISMAPYGEYWRGIRKIVLTELLSPKRVLSFRSVAEEEIEHMIKFIESFSSPVNLSELTHSLANNVVCRVAFGRKYEKFGDSGSSKFHDLLREVQDLAAEFNLSDFFPKMEWLNRINGLEGRVQKLLGELDKVFDEVIEEHLDPKRPNTDHGDLVDVLLRFHNDPNQAIALKTHQVKAAISDVFIAGTDTSATTLEWTMSELMRNPSVMRRAQEEVRRVVKGKKKVEENELSQLVYLKSTLKESFRVHPPAPLLAPRETTESCTIGEYEIPAKARVFVNAAAIAMDPKFWENPNEFNPERFLDSSTDFRGQHFEFIPFGAGRRICPGINFAVQITELALANLLYHFDWAMPNGTTKEGLDMEEAQGLTVHRKTPLYLVSTPATL